jgi:hypothetical protein
MRTQPIIVAIGAALWLGCVGNFTLARTSAAGTSHRPVRRHSAHTRRAAKPAVRGRATSASRVVGNSLTHTYVPTAATGRMPTAQYRVYFVSPAAARAAGYRPVDWHPGQVLSVIKTKMQPHDLPHQPFRRQQPDTAPTNPAPGP